MSLIAENKEEAQSQGIIKISVHYSIVVDTRPLFFSKKKNGACLDKELFHFQFGLNHNSNVDKKVKLLNFFEILKYNKHMTQFCLLQLKNYLKVFAWLPHFGKI